MQQLLKGMMDNKLHEWREIATNHEKESTLNQ